MSIPLQIQMLLIAWSLSARETSLINNNWQFRFKQDLQGQYTRRVDLPHSWNYNDTAQPDVLYRRCIGVYEKSMLFSKDKYENKRVFIRFMGSFQVTYFFVNSRLVGEHRGGYSAFTFEITDFITLDTENVLDAHVNSIEQFDVAPQSGGDFNLYGGLYRDVYIITTEKTSFELLDHGSLGIYIHQQKVMKESAQLQIETKINSQQPGLFDVLLKVFNNNKLIQKHNTTVKISEYQLNQSISANFSFSLIQPHLWDINDPHLYQISVELLQNQSRIDYLEETTGIRFYEVHQNNGFKLNGRQIRLIGSTMHQEKFGVATAISRIDLENDVKLIKEVNFTGMRLIHYQHSDTTYRLCDENGIILLTEIAFVGQGGYKGIGFINSDAFKQNLKLQLREMIKQNINRPSILFWGLFNELQYQEPDIGNILDELNTIAHELDPSRLTYTASNSDDEINGHADLDLHNKYPGWYHQDIYEWGSYLDNYHAQYPDRYIGVSEYGAGGCIYHHIQELVPTVPKSLWHPENYQTFLIIENFKTIVQRQYSLSVMSQEFIDFAAAHRTEGEAEGLHDKGLVTFDRNVKKDIFWFFKAYLNIRDPVLYIAERRYIRREKKVQSFQIFTNQKEVELVVNGVKIGTQQPDEFKTVNFRNITLNQGLNCIKAVSGGIMDEIEITIE